MAKLDSKIFDIQCEETKRLLLAQTLRPESEDYAYIWKLKSEPIKKDAQRVKEDGSVDLNVRPVTQQEADYFGKHRYERGGIIAKIRGDKEISTLTQDKKERASNAFVDKFSMETIKNKFKSMMKGLFKPDYAEIVADELRKRRNEN